MYKRNNFLLATIFAALFFSLQAFAEEAPLPASAELVKQERRRIAGMEMEFSYYTSAQDAQAIKSFYRGQLAKLGWKENAPLAGLRQVEGVTVDASLKERLEANLIFQKGDLMLVINFLPAELARGQKTRFTLCQTQMDLSKVMSLAQAGGQTGFPELLNKPQKEVAPVYPDASLITLSEDADSLRLVYYSRDSIAQAAVFYKEQMPSYGWELTDEQPVRKANSEELGLQAAANCPTCPGYNSALAKKMEMLYGEFEFRNAAQDRCKIAVSNMQANINNQNLASGITTIIVDYAKKK
ncbi:MAG: hypothetical protein Q8N85_05335 [Candidatus Omnitrophota bacterium]|nr:hypothetical protein [Candidatus Omnitrophota bacterium]